MILEPNKNILITGASQGLGMVCAKAMADNNANLVLMARTHDKLENVRHSCKNPDNHLSIACDLTNIQELQNGLRKANDFLGNIDVVLHAAGGGLGLRKSLLSYDEMFKLFALNVSAAVEINRILIPNMIKRKTGNIIHIGSIASNEAVASVGYNTVKAALAAYVRSLGRETASSGVIVTGILPGGFYAPGNSWNKLKVEKPKIVNKYIKELPRGFMGDANELIPMILLLCSDSASMMSGCMIPIDAGQGRCYHY